MKLHSFIQFGARRERDRQHQRREQRYHSNGKRQYEPGNTPHHCTPSGCATRATTTATARIKHIVKHHGQKQ